MNLDQSAPSNAGQGETMPPVGVAEKYKDITAARLLRVQEFIRETLKDPSSERALLGSTNGMLWRLLFQLDDAIQETLEADDSRTPNVEMLARAIDMTLKITRQISGFSRLHYLLGEARRTMPALESLTAPVPRGSEESAA